MDKAKSFRLWKQELFRLGMIINLDIEKLVDNQVFEIHFFDYKEPIKALKECVEVIVRVHEINNNPEN